jgi:hypothetical protein
VLRPGVKTPLSLRAQSCLEQCLPVIDEKTTSPLRVLGHATTDHHEVFEVSETASERKRFVLSVRLDMTQALLVELSPLAAAA